MAKVKFGTVIADIRGSIGGVTYSKNAFGAYAKSKVSPTNPQTAGQLNTRRIFTGLTKTWQSLTQLQREAWTDFGTLYGVPDGFGETKPISGIAAFTRSNIVRASLSLAALNEAPLNYDVETRNFTSISISATLGEVSWNNSGADTLATTYLRIWMTKFAVQLSRDPKDLLTTMTVRPGVIPGGSDTYNYDPANFPFATGDNVFYKFELISSLTGAVALCNEGYYTAT